MKVAGAVASLNGITLYLKKKTERRTERCLFAVVRVHFYSVVSDGQFQGAEKLRVSKSVKDVFDAGKWVRVFLCDCV